MKISQKGLHSLQAPMMLTRHYSQGAIRIRDIAYEENLPEKFLELILLELKNARILESSRGAKGGYRLRQPPSQIRLSEVIRLIDGPLAPFGDASQLRVLINRDANHTFPAPESAGCIKRSRRLLSSASPSRSKAKNNHIVQ
jgi:Rrf2 family protein